LVVPGSVGVPKFCKQFEFRILPVTSLSLIDQYSIWETQRLILYFTKRGNKVQTGSGGQLATW
jgi:hypothetical protein